MSSDVLGLIAEKMRHENFSEEEIKTVETAKGQISSYTTMGTIGGGTTGLLLARAKKMNGFPAMGITVGACLIGSQLGLMFGALKGIRTIQSIPNFQRVLNIVQEVRYESAAGGQGAQHRQHHDQATMMPGSGQSNRFPGQGGSFSQFPQSSSSSSSQRYQRGSELMSDEAVAHQDQSFQGFKGGDGYHGGNDPSGSGSKLEQSNAWGQAEQRAKEIHRSSSSWSQIRKQTNPRSAWDEVRDGRTPGQASNTEDEDQDEDQNDHNNNNSKASPRKTNSKVSAWDRVRQESTTGGDGFVRAGNTPDGTGDFARTREDLESKTSRQKNRYGDDL